GVREERRELGLVDEQLHELLVLGDARQDALERDDLREALDADLFPAEDLGHTAGVDAVEQDVIAELLILSLRGGHGSREYSASSKKRSYRRRAAAGSARAALSA